MQPPASFTPSRFALDEAIAAQRLEQNLAALALRRPDLAELVRQVPPTPLLVAKNGEPTARGVPGHPTRWLHSAYAPSVEAQRLARLVPESACAVLVVGGGLGYLPALLATEPGERQVVLLEPELRHLRAMLTLFDLAVPLASARLVVLRADPADEPWVASLPERPHLVRLPSLADAYAGKLRHHRFQRRLPAARGRVLAIAYKLFVGDVVEELEERGFAVRVVEPSELSVAAFDALCASVRPHVLFSMNHSPELALLATRAGVGYASWTIDPLPSSRLRVLPGTDVARVVAFAHRHELCDELRAAGVEAVAYLPLAAGRRRRAVMEPERLDPYRCPVSFAGVSLAVEREGLERRLRGLGADDLLLRRVLAFVDAEFEAHGHTRDYAGLPVVADALPRWLRQALPSADPLELVDRVNGTLSHRLRMRRVASLVPAGIEVWGDEGWQALGSAYRGRAEHGEQLTAIYGASAVNLDVPRLYQRDIATMRVFDILACGGVLLTEPSAQVLELFRDGEHLFTYRDEAELVARVRELAADPRRARAVAEAGRRLVEERHLLAHRVTAILEQLERRRWFDDRPG